MLYAKSLINWCEMRKAAATFSVLSLALTILLASACGYQPVRYLQVSDALQPIYIRENSALAIEIKRHIIAEGIETTNSVSSAASTIELLDNYQEGRNLTVNIEGKNAESLQQAGVNFIWRHSDGTTLLHQVLDAETLQITNPEKPLASRNETDSVFENLRQDIARQALRLMFEAGKSSTIHQDLKPN